MSSRISALEIYYSVSCLKYGIRPFHLAQVPGFSRSFQKTKAQTSIYKESCGGVFRKFRKHLLVLNLEYCMTPKLAIRWNLGFEGFWNFERFWTLIILVYNSLVSLSLFPTWACGQRRNLSMKVSFSGQAGCSISKIYVLGMQLNWKKEWVLILFMFIPIIVIYFLATKATHLKTKQQESEWSHSTFGSDQNGPRALISACVN